jgi:hypothetical protein
MLCLVSSAAMGDGEGRYNLSANFEGAKNTVGTFVGRPVQKSGKF